MADEKRDNLRKAAIAKFEADEGLKPNGDDVIARADRMSMIAFGRGFDAGHAALADAYTKAVADLATAKQGLEHYADESFWDDLHPDLGYTKGTLYNFEDEIDGEIPGHQIAQQTLAAIGKE